MQKHLQIISQADARRIGMKMFFTGKPCPEGHVSERYVSSPGCPICRAEVTRRLRQDPEYMQRCRDQQREKYHSDTGRRVRQLELHRKRARYQTDPEYRDREKQRLRERSKSEWFREYRRRYLKEWYRDPDNKAILFMRSSLYRVLCESEKAERTEIILGYNRGDLVSHIERQFLDGMTWGNYGEWHIDHIIPVSKMVKEGTTDPSIINCLTNLRPMWASDNISKGSSVESLL